MTGPGDRSACEIFQVYESFHDVDNMLRKKGERKGGSTTIVAQYTLIYALNFFSHSEKSI